MLFGLGAIVLDIGNWYVHKRHLQTQVDAAALAAASGFSSCFFDPTAANLGIASTALAYAGDTARDPSSVNQQVETPGSVRVTLNSQRYWAGGRSRDADDHGVRDDGSDGRRQQCRYSLRDQHARREGDGRRRAKALLVARDPPGHQGARQGGDPPVKEESGFLPLAVPEIDPNYVYAIFVDYAKNGTQTPLKVQPLRKDASYGGAGKPAPARAQHHRDLYGSFPYSAWVTNTDVPGPRTPKRSGHPPPG